jgi:hypothetical protein
VERADESEWLATVRLRRVDLGRSVNHDLEYSRCDEKRTREDGLMSAPPGGDKGKIVYWHRDLPPIAAELMADHTVEGTSGRVAGTISHRDELWQRCYDELMTNVSDRLRQEITRLGGDYAHVHDESIETRHDDATGETWLHGRFAYMLYRRAPQSR